MDGCSRRHTCRNGVAAEVGETPLLEALMQLEEKYRLPLQLHYVEQYPVVEVTRMLCLPQGTVKSRMSRGRQKLRIMIEEVVFE